MVTGRRQHKKSLSDCGDLPLTVQPFEERKKELEESSDRGSAFPPTTKPYLTAYAASIAIRTNFSREGTRAATVWTHSSSPLVTTTTPTPTTSKRPPSLTWNPPLSTTSGTQGG